MRRSPHTFQGRVIRLGRTYKVLIGRVWQDLIKLRDWVNMKILKSITNEKNKGPE